MPFGKGWISDVKEVDESQQRGARFWLNFRLFCLGEAVPDAPAAGRSCPPQRRPRVIAIRTTQELDKAVADREWKTLDYFGFFRTPRPIFSRRACVSLLLILRAASRVATCCFRG